MTQPEISHTLNGRVGRYSITLDDGSEAEMTYRLVEGDVMAIDHTFVPPQHRGGQIAESLVVRGVEDARAGRLRINPVCPYVAVQFRRHPEWQDLLASELR